LPGTGKNRLVALEDAASNRISQLDEVAPRSYLGTMRAVGLKILKNRLSEYVRLAATGETVLVTDRDRVVAELGPPREGRSPLLADARLAEAVRHGWITPPALPRAEPPPRRPLMTLRKLLKELGQDRADR
jgi:antitoxin (DNA-binding transcriptional repressor) of toxin-antitoxin stability system